MPPATTTTNHRSDHRHRHRPATLTARAPPASPLPAPAALAAPDIQHRPSGRRAIEMHPRPSPSITQRDQRSIKSGDCTHSRQPTAGSSSASRVSSASPTVSRSSAIKKSIISLAPAARAGQQPGPPLRRGKPVRLDPLQRTAGRGRHRAVGGQSRRQLRQRAGRDDQRPAQGRADPPPRAVEDQGSGRTGDPGMGVLVQPSPAARAHRSRAAGGVRGRLLSSTRRVGHVGLTHTNGPPRVPGRFKLMGDPVALGCLHEAPLHAQVKDQAVDFL